MAPNVPIILMVEDKSFVPIMRILRRLDGIIGIESDVTRQLAYSWSDLGAKKFNGSSDPGAKKPAGSSDPPAKKPPKGALQDLTIEMLLNATGPLTMKGVADEAVKVGFKASSVEQTFYGLVKKNIAVRVGPGIYVITPEARAQYGTPLPQLPPPKQKPVPKSAINIVLFALAAGMATKEDLKKVFKTNKLSPRTLDNTLFSMSKESLLKSIAPGVYELLAAGKKKAIHLAQGAEA